MVARRMARSITGAATRANPDGSPVLVSVIRVPPATAQGPFPMRTTYTWEPAAGGTRMTLTNTGDPSGFARVAAPVMERAMRRATTRDLARLRAVLEGRA